MSGKGSGLKIGKLKTESKMEYRILLREKSGWGLKNLRVIERGSVKEELSAGGRER